MTLILSGTDGLSDVDGSAATPAIRGTDANTGIFFPAADQVAITTGGTQRAVVDASGYVGIGTSSPNRPLHLVSSGTTTPMRIDSGGSSESLIDFKDTATTADFKVRVGSSGDNFVAFAGGSERMRIDSSGNVGIGTSSPTQKLDVNGNVRATGEIAISGSDFVYSWAGGTTGQRRSGFYLDGSNQVLRFYTAQTEVGRFDSSGKLLVGTTSIPFSSANSGVISWSVATGNGGEGGFVFQNTNTSASSDANPALVISKGSSTYTSSQRFVQFNANGTSQQAMGGIVGNGATNVQFISLSDIREKENIEPITGSLNKVVALNPVEFDWKKTGEHITAGFIAQEVESLFPEYVVDNVANAGEEERKGLTGGMSAGFIAHLVKAIQEQQALITTLTDRITALEAK